MKNRFKSFLNRNLIFVLSFTIPFLIMLIIFIARGIYPFGDESFLHVDMYHQYYPFLKEFYRVIHEGESMLYSFNTGMGTDFFALMVYYFSSPFNLLALIIPEGFLIEYMSYLVIIKIGLSGLTFAYYLNKHFNTKSISIVYFAICYSMSGYFAAYNWNVMWLDCIVLAPLVILGLEKLVNEAKPALYCITLGICIFTNYYLSIMICIYLVLYFFVLLVSADKKIKACFNFALYSLLSGGMAAVLLIPEARILMASEYSKASFPTFFKAYFSLYECFARHFINVQVETGLDHWPNIYCGVAILILITLYLLCKKIPLKIRIAKAILLVFMLAGFCINSLNFIWHGMNYPDSLPARQSFLYILLLLTVCFEALMYIKEYSNKKIIIAFGLAGIFVAISPLFSKSDAFSVSTFIITGIFLIVYAVAIILYRKEKFNTRNIAFYVMLLLVVETSVNMLLTSVPTVTRSSYIAEYENYENLIKECEEEDSSFYRMDKFERLTQNDAMLADYRSATLFSSVSNPLIHNYYKKYGLRASKVFYAFQGNTPLTTALFNVKYMLSSKPVEDNSLFSLESKDENAYLYKNNYYLNPGFMVYDSDRIYSNKDISDFKKSKEVLENSSKADDSMLNTIKEQNVLAYDLGADTSLFNDINVSLNDKDTTVIVPKSGYIYIHINNSAVKTLNVTFEDGEEKEFTKLKNPYIVNLGFQEEGSIIELKSPEVNSAISCSAYIFNENEFEKLINRLNSQSLNVTSYDSTSINGTIDVKKAGELVISIPFDTGWSIYVDGIKAPVNVYDNLFISTTLDEGHHEIELIYTNDSIKLGAIISFGSIGIFALIMFIRKKVLKIS